MALQSVKIPQNVYIEDHVVGPLTLRQTIIITIGGGFSYMIFAMLQKAYGNPGLPLTIIAWTPCFISVMFALVKINDLSLLRIVFLTLERLSKAPTRTFTPRTGISVNIRFSNPKPEVKAAVAAVHPEDRIQELSSIVDRPIERLTAAVAPAAALPTAESPFIDDMHPLSAPPKAEKPNTKSQIPGSDDETPQGDLSIFRDIFSPKQ